jgi:ubiquinone/menaquinone biosynthesis C-methylase UbiE
MTVSAMPPTLPELYERELVGPLFRPWAEELIARAGLSPGDRILDIACGTGIVARLAREKTGPQSRVTGIDLSPDMLKVARSLEPRIEWIEGNAESLPLDPNERFDVVFCHQGLQFVADRPAAAREMRRVLDGSGRAVVAVWRAIEEAPLFLDLKRVAERHLGTITDRRHGFSDEDELGRLFRAAGFAEVQVEKVSKTLHFPSGEPLVRLNTMAVVGMSEKGPSLSDGERAKVVAAIVSDSMPLLARYAEGTGITFDIGANIAEAKA